MRNCFEIVVLFVSESDVQWCGLISTTELQKPTKSCIASFESESILLAWQIHPTLRLTCQVCNGYIIFTHILVCNSFWDILILHVYSIISISIFRVDSIDVSTATKSLLTILVSASIFKIK